MFTITAASACSAFVVRDNGSEMPHSQTGITVATTVIELVAKEETARRQPPTGKHANTGIASIAEIFVCVTVQEKVGGW